jgi:hypothetical protein
MYLIFKPEIAPPMYGHRIAFYEWGASGISTTLYWCPAPGIKQNATSVELAVPNHGAVDSGKIGIQGCQIFLGTKYQNWEKYTKLPRTIPNVRKI